MLNELYFENSQKKDAFERRSRQTDGGLKKRVCKMRANGMQRKQRELLQRFRFRP